MIFELVVQVFAFVTYVGYHLGLKQGRKPASLAALPHVRSAFATGSNSTHCKEWWSCPARPDLLFLPLNETPEHCVRCNKRGRSYVRQA